MSDMVQIWGTVMPIVKNEVTGVGIWSALNQSQAVAFEDNQFVIGLPHESSELAGHLKLQNNRILIERRLSEHTGKQITLRVIEGILASDWELTKRKDSEAKRLQEAAINRARVEMEARSSWDTIYEQLSRNWAGLQNKSLPQYRVRFFDESCKLIVESLKTMKIEDDVSERNYARCLERIAQYTDIPSVLVALEIHRRTSG
jgi:hypothetical protein